MARLAVVPGASDRAAHRPAAAPLYRQVCDAVERLALALPLGDEGPLPPEGELMARFGVSRGTLRRATDELARQGLLRIEPGRGTYVHQPAKVRVLVWERLATVARPDSRFDLDLSRFIPDFEGRERCDEQLLALDAFGSAATIFVTPDNSLEAVRRQVLEAGKRLLVPTYGLRRGFVLLDGAQIDLAAYDLAATLDGMERFGRALALDDLAGTGAAGPVGPVGPVGLVVTGAVAVTRQGLHFGAGDGYFDLEWGLLRHFGLATPQTPVVASVHDCQVLDTAMRPGPHDAVVDLVITPTQVRQCAPSLPKPDGILWHEIRGAADLAVPYVHELVAQQQSVIWDTPAPSTREGEDDT